ncbi:hypothetical protein GCM10009133_35710 [Cocleimonas flava]
MFEEEEEEEEEDVEEPPPQDDNSDRTNDSISSLIIFEQLIQIPFTTPSQYVCYIPSQ